MTDTISGPPAATLPNARTLDDAPSDNAMSPKRRALLGGKHLLLVLLSLFSLFPVILVISTALRRTRTCG